MTQRPRVLLVDDDALCLRLLQALITDACGAEVDAFINPLHALDRARDCPYNLVVTDLRMPELTGTELTDQLLSLQPTIPVILITGELSQPEELAPFHAILAKPLDRQHFIQTIQAALAPSVSE
jgi:two-component system cell cycle response regulator CpdR